MLKGMGPRQGINGPSNAEGAAHRSGEVIICAGMFLARFRHSIQSRGCGLATLLGC